MAQSQYKVHPSALLKMVLHAYKYPSMPVFGAIVGYTEENTIHVTDALPLFHGRVLAPMLEMAIFQVRPLLKSFFAIFFFP
jgi:hypothetical protein